MEEGSERPIKEEEGEDETGSEAARAHVYGEPREQAGEGGEAELEAARRQEQAVEAQAV
jgi:hypothetical protein